MRPVAPSDTVSSVDLDLAACDGHQRATVGPLQLEPLARAKRLNG